MTSTLRQAAETCSGNDDAPVSQATAPQSSQIRACTNCVRAKAKCSALSQSGCERCRRMNKFCQPSPPIRKRRTVKRPTADVASKLEEKLDGLVTLLKSATQSSAGAINGVPTHLPPDMPVQSGSESVSSSTPTSGPDNHDYAYHKANSRRAVAEFMSTPPISTSSDSAPAVLSPPVHPALNPSAEDAQLYLNIFRDDFAIHVPFIVIPQSMTAPELRRQSPLLWLCIMTVATKDATQQVELSRQMRHIFGREAYVEGTRNMDLLFAVLVYAAWDRRHFFEKSILISLLQLAIAVLYDLGLDKPPSKDPAFTIAYELKGISKPARLSRSPTMEERRAFLGCFVMSSVTTLYFRKGSTLGWTAYGDECLRVLEKQNEFPSDLLLVQMVKLRLISERAIHAPWSGAGAEMHRVAGPPAMLYLKSLESQLQDFKSNIPVELANNTTLLMELHATDVIIHECGLSQATEIFTGQYNHRLDCLYACLNASKSWAELFLTIPPAQYVAFSASMYSNMARCFIAISRLMAFEHPEWDRRFIRDTLDVSSFLQQAEENFMQVAEAAGLDVGSSEGLDFFRKLALKFRFIKTSCSAVDGFLSSAQSLPPADGLGDFSMELPDDEWLRELLGPWNEQWDWNIMG